MSKAKIIAGVDVGSSKVATTIASEGEGEKTIRVLGSASIPSRGIRKGQIVNIEEASDVIIESVEAAERMAGYSLGHVFVSVGGQQVASQNSKGVVAVAEPENEINQEDVRRVTEAAKAVSLPSSREIVNVLTRSYSVDGQGGIADPVGMSGVRLEVEAHIVTGATTAIRNLTKCVSEIGADIAGLVITGVASAEAVLTETEKELGVILIDLGGGTTSMVVFLEGSPAYTSILPVGARNVTNDLAIGLRLPLDAAEKVKVYLSKNQNRPKTEELEKKKKSKRSKDKLPIVPKKEWEDEFDLAMIGAAEDSKKVSRRTLVEGIIRPRLNEIFNLVGMELKKSGLGGMTPSGVVLCGGGAKTVGVVDSARRTLSLPVRVGLPQDVTGLVDDVLTPEFAASVGLVKYAFKKGFKTNKRFSNLVGQTLAKFKVRGLAERAFDLVKSVLP
ncbi:MAG: cell division protein FtsA [Candidatus Pacebacteria bacterium]|nr:cell division protein FtsA [Candidatus Paceibacterota bacterium]